MNTENNKIIAEFVSKENPYHKGHYICHNGIATLPKNMKFHSDWNWLMEVVEKIESLENERFKVDIYGNISTIIDTKGLCEIFCYNCDTKINVTFSICLEFIKWYNQNK